MSRRWRVLCLILRVIVKMRGIVNKSREKMKLYCCRLFPNDFEFERETLVRLWMAMGFSSQSCIEKFCERYFDTLLEEQCIIFTSIDVKTGRNLYKLNHHGKFNMGEKKTVYEEDFYILLEDEEANGSKPGHISLVSNCINNETTFKKLQKFDGELRTLLFIHNYGPSLNKIPSDMFLILESLRALDLSGSDIVELPRSIGNVRQLRYLDLSFTLIESLPESIDQLHQLQTLKLQGCKHLHELPKEIKELICLRHLDLDVLGQLTFLPKGIGALTELCTLSAFLVDSEEGCSIPELKFLNKLKGSLCISGLENVAHVNEVQEAALQDKKYVTQLQLRWSDRISYSNEDKQLGNNIIAFLNLNRGLQDLQIVCYPGSDIPAWVDFRVQQNLISITLLNCNNNDLSLPLGQLPNLKYLSIIHMNWVPKIKGWSHKVGDEAYVAFPKLEKLEIECMFILERWIDEFKHGDFPFLSTLIIKQCPKLTRLLFLPHLQVLKHLEMSHCIMLECLPEGTLPASLETLIIDDCPFLKKRCSKEGEDWHKVNHIPNIWIDLQNIGSNGEDGDFDDNSSTIEDICSTDEDVCEDINPSADTSSLIPQIGEDNSMYCIARCSRSDYGSIAQLNRSFRSIVEGKVLYTLRRQMGIVEHWIYFSCNVGEWEVFDPIRLRWKHLPIMPSDDCFTLSHKESLAVGTELLVFGKALTSPLIYKYSLLTNSWSMCTEMNTPRCLFGSATLGEKAIVAGGCDFWDNIFSSAELYNSDTGRWETLPSMNKARKKCSAVFMDGKFYVIGGLGVENSNPLTCGEVYDLERRTWTEIQDMLPLRTAEPGASRASEASRASGASGASGASAMSGAPPLLTVVNNELYEADYAQKEVRKYNKGSNSWATVGTLPDRAVSKQGWGLAFQGCGDKLIVLGGPGVLDGDYVEINSWAPSESPQQWTVLGSNWSGGFVYNCAIMGC